MCELRVNTFLLLFFFFFFFILTSLIAAQNCPPVTCGSKSFNIRFPFLLQGNQNQDCGYHGFHLSCSSGSSSFLSETVLKLPNSGDFFVRDISYAKQRINLSDPRNCLAKRLMRLNLSDSPYSAAYVLNFMFLNCSSRNLGFRPNFGVIDCLSDGKNTVLAISSTFWASYMISSYSCMLIETVPVPVSWPMKEDDGYIVDLNDNKLQLSWGTPDCRDCEEDGGTCGLLNYTRQEIGCFNKKTGDSSGRKIARIVSLSITVPALMCSFGIAFSRCCRNREGSEGNGSNSSEQTALQPTVSMFAYDMMLRILGL
ncbi:hypothetical protein SAY87_000694 [Trapa incisa]|uniref:Uncharacterized protein n=1 Tax=Trapa incisa TaxID=236973 RepID=A0AAN7GEY1_9MYRT|nr:hypothetical protein SAY87_000694 [Trapa incisa]